LKSETELRQTTDMESSCALNTKKTNLRYISQRLTSQQSKCLSTVKSLLSLVPREVLEGQLPTVLSVTVLVINFSNKPIPANEIAEKVGTERAIAVQADVSRVDELHRLVRETVDKFEKSISLSIVLESCQ
jgi:hypothetical protein